MDLEGGEVLSSLVREAREKDIGRALSFLSEDPHPVGELRPLLYVDLL